MSDTAEIRAMQWSLLGTGLLPALSGQGRSYSVEPRPVKFAQSGIYVTADSGMHGAATDRRVDQDRRYESQQDDCRQLPSTHFFASGLLSFEPGLTVVGD